MIRFLNAAPDRTDRLWQVTDENPLPRNPQCSGDRHCRRYPDQIVRVGATQCLGHPAPAQSGVGDHNRRASAPTGVHGSRQLEPRRHQQRDTVAGPHAGMAQRLGDRVDARGELGERRQAGTAAARLRDRCGRAGASRDVNRRAGRALGGRRLRLADAGTNPCPRVISRLGYVFGHQMRRARVPVDVGLRQLVFQVAEECR